MSTQESRKYNDKLLQNAVEKLSPKPNMAAIISVDGLLWASSVIISSPQTDTEEDRLGAISASTLSMLERANEVLGHGEVRDNILCGMNGIFIMVIVDDWILSTKFSTLPSLDDMRSQLYNIVQKIKPQLISI